MMKMKNKKRFLRVISALIIAVLMIATLASCAVGGTSGASDAEGTHGELSWVYKKDTQTLTVTGKGAMKDFESNEDIAWGKVASSVKKLVVGEGVTSVGNYAFFCMTALEEVSLPESLTSIGKLSFAFTSSLKTIEIPEGVKTIEYGTFEASGLESVTGKGITKIEENAFAYCKALKTMKFSDGNPEVKENAFLDAKTNQIVAYDGTVNITFNLVDADDTSKILGTEIKSAPVNTSYTYTPKAIEGYTAVTSTVTVQVENSGKTVSVSYKKAEVETESQTEEPQTAPVDPADEKLEPWTIVAFVVTVLVIIGIIIGTVLFIRNDKKKSNSRTVRKNKDEKKDKKKK